MKPALRYPLHPVEAGPKSLYPAGGPSRQEPKTRSLRCGNQCLFRIRGPGVRCRVPGIKRLEDKLVFLRLGAPQAHAILFRKQIWSAQACSEPYMNLYGFDIGDTDL